MVLLFLGLFFGIYVWKGGLVIIFNLEMIRVYLVYYYWWVFYWCCVIFGYLFLDFICFICIYLWFVIDFGIVV